MPPTPNTPAQPQAESAATLSPPPVTGAPSSSKPGGAPVVCTYYENTIHHKWFYFRWPDGSIHRTSSKPLVKGELTQRTRDGGKTWSGVTWKIHDPNDPRWQEVTVLTPAPRKAVATLTGVGTWTITYPDKLETPVNELEVLKIEYETKVKVANANAQARTERAKSRHAAIAGLASRCVAELPRLLTRGLVAYGLFVAHDVAKGWLA